jgi:hypothetical protein
MGRQVDRIHCASLRIAHFWVRQQPPHKTPESNQANTARIKRTDHSLARPSPALERGVSPVIVAGLVLLEKAVPTERLLEALRHAAGAQITLPTRRAKRVLQKLFRQDGQSSIETHVNSNLE